jgi:hypothetical protein
MSTRGLATYIGAMAIPVFAVGGYLLLAEAREPGLTRAEESAVARAALNQAGKGEVRSIRSESDDVPRAVYEVEVIKRDGAQLDIHLDRKYAVVKVEDETVPPDDDD